MDLTNRLLTDEVKEHLQGSFQALDGTINNIEIEIDPSKEDKFGDYQCSEALKLAKILGKSPRDIANDVVDRLKEKDIFSNVEVAGPGFINMTFSNDILNYWVNACLESADLLIPKRDQEKIVIDFSSPNIAKSMHVGHLRSTIIGESIARLMEFLGHDVLRLNHVGDFGTQFGMLISYLRRYKPYALEEQTTASLDELVVWYKHAKEKFDQDESFQKESREEVVKLQSQDPESVKSWESICEISRKGFSAIYDLLDVHIIERGESFYSPSLKQVVENFMEQKLAVKDQGALCVFMDMFKGKEGKILPLIIQKKRWWL